MWRLRNVFIGCSSILLIAVFTSVAMAKPLSPVQVSIEPAASPLPGKPVDFMVRASVTVDAENLQINVTVPQGVVIRQGKLSWRGTVLKGEEKILRFTVNPVTSEEKLIQVQAVIPGPENSLLSATAFYRLRFSVNAMAVKATPLPNSRIVERAGRKIQEYLLRP